MSATLANFPSWIQSLPKWHGLLRISPERAYAHAEDKYDAQYGVTAPIPGEGQGLCALLEKYGVDTSGPALEIGCGTGRLSYGLARHYPGPDVVITDPSPAFLKLTGSLFPDGAPGPARLHLALFNADDLGELPAGMFSVVTMRSTLHHISHVDKFIAGCARTLRPGGAVALSAEPVESGYLLMGVVAQSIEPTLKAAGVELRPAWRERLQHFSETIRFYCRRDFVKDTVEDKHLFTTHELTDLGFEHGLRLRYLANCAFSEFAPPYVPSFESFGPFFLNYLRDCMLFDAEFMEQIRIHLQPQLKFIEDCYRSHPGPAVNGVFLFLKDKGGSSA